MTIVFSRSSFPALFMLCELFDPFMKLDADENLMQIMYVTMNIDNPDMFNYGAMKSALL